MWPRFGIKIGNSTLCIASAKKDGKVEIIPNKQGDRVSQAVLLYDGGEMEVGLIAKQKMISKASSTVCNSFQLFPKDLSDDEIENALKYIPCKFDKKAMSFCLQSEDENGTIKKITPFNTCVELFKMCFELVRQYHLFDEHPSVILSVPHYFPLSCWHDFANAAESAGFSVAQVITEATAALVAYESEITQDNDDAKHILYIKSGGLLTSFSLFEVCCNVYSIVGSSQPFYMGGNQFTNILVDFIVGEFYKKYQLDPNESGRSLAKIRIAADNCKHALTTLPSTQIYIESLMDGIDFNIQMSRARFESLIQPVINEFMTLLNNFLKEHNMENHTINEVILVGGTLKIPKIQGTIQSKFSDAHLKINFSLDEVAAIGCAQQSLYVDPKVKELKSDMSCASTTNDIFIWYDENINDRKVLLKKGTILPRTSILEFKSECILEEAMFNIQSTEYTEQIRISNIRPINGIFRIRAVLEMHLNALKIKLSCI